MGMNAHFNDDLVTLYHGTCEDVLPTLATASVDAVVTDPPYGLEFMGHDWDSFGSSSAAAGMSKPGFGDRDRSLAWPSHLGGLNPRCQTCEQWQRGANPCQCDEPDFPNERRQARMRASGQCPSLATRRQRLNIEIGRLRQRESQLEAQVEVLELANSRLRCVCDAAFSVVRDDGAEDGWTTWQELVSALEDARYEPRP